MTNAASVALIGCGYWGKNVARLLGEAGALVAICDTNPQAARAAVESSGERLGPDLVCPRTGQRHRKTESGVVPAD